MGLESAALEHPCLLKISQLPRQLEVCWGLRDLETGLPGEVIVEDEYVKQTALL